MRRRRLVLTASFGLYLAILGFLAGMLVERMVFDQRRADVLSRLTSAERRLHGRLMDLERSLR
jgi:hypothetical protein